MTTKLKLPEPRVYQMDPAYGRWYSEDLKDIGFGSRFAGHLRKGEYHLELGGPAHNYTGFIFVEYCPDVSDVREGVVEHYGPDINEVPPESSFPFMWHIKTAGMQLTPDVFPMVERGVVMGFAWTEGLMVMGQRANTWIRVSKKVAPRLSVQKLAQAIYASIKTWGSVAERVEQKIIIATPEMGGAELIRPLLEETKPRWEAQDARLSDVKDEDVDEFYGCTICRMIAPTHCCIITPERAPYCGFLNYSAVKVFQSYEPSGFMFAIPKGKCLDGVRGWYTGVDEVAYDKSGGRTRKVFLNSCIQYPTTN